MAAEEIRSIKDIKKDILDIKAEIEPEKWDKLTKLLDEIFVAYFIRATDKELSELLDELYHYERHNGNYARTAISDFRNMVESRRMSEAKASYKVMKMMEGENDD